MEEGEHGTIGTALLLADARLERLVRIFGSPVRRRRQLLRGELFDQHIGTMDRPDDILGRRMRGGNRLQQRPGPFYHVRQRVGDADLVRIAGRHLQQQLDDQLADRHAVGQGSPGDLLPRHGVHVAPKTRILRLETGFDARILRHHPEVADQQRMRIQLEELFKRRRRRSGGAAVTEPGLGGQVRKTAER